MMLAADVIEAAQQIPTGGYVGGALGGIVVWYLSKLRSTGIDLLNRLRFVVGFLTLFAKHFKSINRAMDSVDEREMTPALRKVWREVRPLFNKTETLVDEFIGTPDTNGSKFDSELVEMLKKFIHDKETPIPPPRSLEDK